MPQPKKVEAWEESYDSLICGHHIGIGNDSKIIREFISSTLEAERARVVELIKEKNWHAIIGANGMCECGSPGSCGVRLIDAIKSIETKG